MKKVLLFAIIVSAISCNYSRRGSGTIVTETRNLAPFTSVNVTGSIDVEVQQGDKSEVVVEADDNIIQYIETESAGGTLTIRLKRHSSLRNATLHVRLISPEYKSLSTSASAEITSLSTLTSANKITLKASSSSEMKLQLDVPSIFIDASSSADLTLSGRTKQIDINTSSSSDVDMQQLKAETVTANASSSSTVILFASLAINASASSSADISYTGGATNVQKKESSSGTVTVK